MTENVWHISVYRYSPEKDLKPYMQSYTVAKELVYGQMLLDLLHVIKEQDPTIGFRRSCGEGVCGSDGMNINGQNGLACITPLSNFKNSIIVVRPLPGMPVIKDLIVDLELFYKQYHNVKPYLENSGSPPSREYLQSPEEREKLDGLYECILCACCTSACPYWWWNSEKFLGPAAAINAGRWIFDSRDDKTEERLASLDDHYKIFRCRSILNCASVCPKGLNPSAVISKIKQKLFKQET